MAEKKLKLSPSGLKLFWDCRLCFWLDKKNGIKRPTGPMASVAIGLDSKLKNYINRYRQEGKQPPLLEEYLKKYHAKMVPKFMSYLKLETDSAIFSGKLDDCLILEGNLYAPLDHKTRASFTDNVHETYQLQMDAYDWLLQVNGYPTAAKAYLAYYAPMDGELHNGFPCTSKN